MSYEFISKIAVRPNLTEQIELHLNNRVGVSNCSTKTKQECYFPLQHAFFTNQLPC